MSLLRPYASSLIASLLSLSFLFFFLFSLICSSQCTWNCLSFTFVVNLTYIFRPLLASSAANVSPLNRWVGTFNFYLFPFTCKFICLTSVCMFMSHACQKNVIHACFSLSMVFFFLSRFICSFIEKVESHEIFFHPTHLLFHQWTHFLRRFIFYFTSLFSSC